MTEAEESARMEDIGTRADGLVPCDILCRKTPKSIKVFKVVFSGCSCNLVSVITVKAGHLCRENTTSEQSGREEVSCRV